MRQGRGVMMAALLVLMSVACALAALTVLLMLLPDTLIGRTDWYTRFQAGQEMAVEWRPSDGDIFAALPGRVRPPDDDGPYAAFTLRWDAQGFREPAVPFEGAPIIAAFGDSFTEGFAVEYPWPDVLDAESGFTVSNYGFRAYGPVEVARAAREVLTGMSPAPKVVLWGFFMGNDLGDALRPPRIDARNPLAAWSALIDNRLRGPAPTPTPRTGDDGQPQYDLPVPVIIGGSYYEMAFINYYGGWQQGAPGDFLASENLKIASATLDAFDSALPDETCRALVLIPTKEALYTRYVYPSERQFLRAANQRAVLDETGALVLVDAPVSDADEMAWLDAGFEGQREALGLWIASHPGWTLIDLTEAFAQRIAQGELLYYPYDTHWNQAGHDLAARVIADALEGMPECLP
jgi:hypothetical protein